MIIVREKLKENDVELWRNVRQTHVIGARDRTSFETLFWRIKMKLI